jgi:hypothetical protein
MGFMISGCDTFTMAPYCSNTPCLGCFYQ